MDLIPKKIKVMKTLGVPYRDGYEQEAVADYMKQANKIVEDLKASGIEVEANKEVIALINILIFSHKIIL